MRKILRQIKSVYMILVNNFKRTFLTSMGIIIATTIYIFGNVMIENYNEMNYRYYYDFPSDALLINNIYKTEIYSINTYEYDDFKNTYAYSIKKPVDNLKNDKNVICIIDAVTPNYCYFPVKSADTENSLEPIELVAGRYLNDNDYLIGNPVINISQGFANLFFDDNPIGKSLSIGGNEFEIVGILKNTNDVERICSGNLDNLTIKVYTTLSCFEKLNLFHNGKYHMISRSKDINRTAFILKNELHLNGISRDDIYNNIIESNKGMNILLNVLLISIVIISCIIILITMLFNIKERIFEYGIKMAIGADKNDISFSVLVEGLIYSLLGIVFGFVLAIIISVIYSYAMYVNVGFFSLRISFSTIITGILIPLTSIMLFSIIPAIIVSKKNIVDCLKAE